MRVQQKALGAEDQPNTLEGRMTMTPTARKTLSGSLLGALLLAAVGCSQATNDDTGSQEMTSSALSAAVTTPAVAQTPPAFRRMTDAEVTAMLSKPKQNALAAAPGQDKFDSLVAGIKTSTTDESRKALIMEYVSLAEQLAPDAQQKALHTLEGIWK
jgi:hypothetical protein